MTISGTVPITLTATNTTPVLQATVYIDGLFFDTQVSVQGATTWTFSLDTTKFSGTLLSPQNHTLKTVLYDTYGNAVPQTITVTIAN